MTLFMNIGSFISYLSAGLVYQTTGTYSLGLATYFPMYLLSALASLLYTRPMPSDSGQRDLLGTGPRLRRSPRSKARAVLQTSEHEPKRRYLPREVYFDSSARRYNRFQSSSCQVISASLRRSA